jgi:hypothetical protein
VAVNVSQDSSKIRFSMPIRSESLGTLAISVRVVPLTRSTNPMCRAAMFDGPVKVVWTREEALTTILD